MYSDGFVVDFCVRVCRSHRSRVLVIGYVAYFGALATSYVITYTYTCKLLIINDCISFFFSRLSRFVTSCWLDFGTGACCVDGIMQNGIVLDEPLVK